MFIERTAVIAAAAVFMSPLTAYAETADRDIITDEMYIAAVEETIDWECERVGGSSLAEGFIAEDMAGSSEADWFMIAEHALGLEDDFEGYIAAAGVPDVTDGELLTEPARRNVTLALLGGKGSDMSGAALDEAGCNELVWVVLSQRLNGYDSTAAEQRLTSMQQPDGGFGLMGSDADITAMALTVLDGDAADRAEKWLTENIGGMSCETAAWCIIAACSQSSRASLNDDLVGSDGARPIDILFSCRGSDGGFSHTPDGESEVISTAQALTALAALAEYGAGGEGIFDGKTADTDIYAQHNIAGEDSFALGQLEKIGELNREIRAGFYPPEDIKITRLRELSRLNERIQTVAPCYRHYIIASADLSAREAKFKKLSAAGVAFGVVWKIAAVILLIRFRKTKLAKKLYKKIGRYLPKRKKKREAS